jgi:proteasome lid subunit RPN8/RPN11
MTKPPFVLSSDLQEQLEEHAFSRTDAEVGGFLVGVKDAGSSVKLTGIVPALSAESGQAHLTITHDVWDEVLPQVEQEFPGDVIIGWYHTHPGFGLFLSPYDMFIQEGFFPSEHQVALVIDPLAGELGYFGWRDGEVVETHREATTRAALRTESADGSSPQSAAGRRRISSIAVAVAMALALVVFVGGWFIGQNAATTVTSSAVASTPAPTVTNNPTGDDGKMGNVKLDPATGEVLVRYEVRSGDSWWRIAENFRGDGDKYEAIVRAANPKVKKLYAGQVVVVPVQLKDGPR